MPEAAPVLCSQCHKWPVSRNSDLCGHCRDLRNTEGRPPEDRYIIDHLLGQWQILPGIPLTWHFAYGEELERRWQGFRAELVLVPRVGLLLAHPWYGPDVVDDELDTGEPIPSAVLRIRLWRTGIRGFLEQWCERGASKYRYALYDLHSAKDLEVFARATRETVKPGPESGRFLKEDWAIYRHAYLAWLETYDRRPTMADLAAQLNWDRSTLTRKRAWWKEREFPLHFSRDVPE